MLGKDESREATHLLDHRTQVRKFLKQVERKAGVGSQLFTYP